MRHTWSFKQEESLSITIYNVPEDLIKEFAEKVIKPDYPGGISPAIKDLVQKAVEEKKLEEAHLSLSPSTEILTNE
jgi:predicted transcriptional regulator of viral defense system